MIAIMGKVKSNRFLRPKVSIVQIAGYLSALHLPYSGMTYQSKDGVDQTESETGK